MKVVIPQIYFSLSELLFHLMISFSLPEYNNYVLDLLTMYWPATNKESSSLSTRPGSLTWERTLNI